VDEIALGMGMNCHLISVMNSSRAKNGQAKQTNKKGDKTEGVGGGARAVVFFFLCYETKCHWASDAKEGDTFRVNIGG
jgi:hypothetical protein